MERLGFISIELAYLKIADLVRLLPLLTQVAQSFI